MNLRQLFAGERLFGWLFAAGMIVAIIVMKNQPMSRPWIYGGVGVIYLVCYVAASWVSGREKRERRRVEQGLCAVCGYDLRASPLRCPECGSGSPMLISYEMFAIVWAEPPVLDEEAASALWLAHEEGWSLGHDHVGTEHLLIALLVVEEGAGELHERLGLTPDECHASVAEAVGWAEPAQPPRQLPATPALLRALSAARSRAQAEQRLVNPRDLLHAIESEPDSAAAAILAGLSEEVEPSGEHST